MRLVDPDSGTIYIDDNDLRNLQLNDFRKQVGCVPQDVFLFSDTIAQNIAFGLEGNTDTNKIEEAAQMAAIYNNIKEFPKGFETMVGERGITLSGGQKQRISIARAIIKEPRILIFDDCLSAVDTITEEQILKNLSIIMKGKTTILVSHRVSSVKDADHIIVLDEGKIVEEGKHTELLTHNGVYSALFEMQLMEEKETK